MADAAPITVVQLPPGYELRQRRGMGCGPMIFIALLVLGAGYFFGGKKSLDDMARAAGAHVSAPGPLAKKWFMGSGDAQIAVISVEGTISADESRGAGFFSVSSKLVDRVRRELREAAKDDAVKGVLLSVDSPGGAVTPSDEILELVRRFQDGSKKPVVVHMGALAASGGYYISCSADKIVCEPTTITGSIGVIMQTFNFYESMNLFKVQPVTIKSGANKDLMNPFTPVNQKHIEIIQGMIDSAYDRFVMLVAKGRKMDEAKVRELADGRIYTAEQAKANGLVDRIGYIDDAIDEMATLVKQKDLTLFKYTSGTTLFGALAGEGAETSARMDAGSGSAAIEALREMGSPRLMMLWSPTTAPEAK